jgi:hypothetical protein
MFFMLIISNYANGGTAQGVLNTDIRRGRSLLPLEEEPFCVHRWEAGWTTEVVGSVGKDVKQGT